METLADLFEDFLDYVSILFEIVDSLFDVGIFHDFDTDMVGDFASKRESINSIGNYIKGLGVALRARMEFIREITS
jgi:hypothetical protein